MKWFRKWRLKREFGETNFRKIDHSFYRVRNQRGFNAALYDCFLDPWNTKAQIRAAVKNWPRRYPCFVTFDSDYYHECGRIVAEIN